MLIYWLNQQSYFKQQYTNVRQLIVLQRKLNLVYDPTLSLKAIEHNINLHIKNRKSVIG